MAGDAASRNARWPVATSGLVMTAGGEDGAVCEPGGETCAITGGAIAAPADPETQERDA